eukprot:TRINITY_DN915_c2_g1_i4.p1 TRINITY_DN915_c2_g1~~TRINITY_DN915_c2_g1_i4.p1  ORF type:complete len:556 (-),score=158.17 TRINITY_DN915_c2_g1_i4:641-2308(-)
MRHAMPWCLALCLLSLLVPATLALAQTETVFINTGSLVIGSVAGIESHQPLPGVCLELGILDTDNREQRGTAVIGSSGRGNGDEHGDVTIMPREFGEDLGLSHVMRMRTDRHGEFSFMIPSHALASSTATIVLSVYSAGGAVPSFQHVIVPDAGEETPIVELNLRVQDPPYALPTGAIDAGCHAGAGGFIEALLRAWKLQVEDAPRQCSAAIHSEAVVDLSPCDAQSSTGGAGSVATPTSTLQDELGDTSALQQIAAGDSAQCSWASPMAAFRAIERATRRALGTSFYTPRAAPDLSQERSSTGDDSGTVPWRSAVADALEACFGHFNRGTAIAWSSGCTSFGGLGDSGSGGISGISSGPCSTGASGGWDGSNGNKTCSGNTTCSGDGSACDSVGSTAALLAAARSWSAGRVHACVALGSATAAAAAAAAAAAPAGSYATAACAALALLYALFAEGGARDIAQLFKGAARGSKAADSGASSSGNGDCAVTFWGEAGGGGGGGGSGGGSSGGVAAAAAQQRMYEYIGGGDEERFGRVMRALDRVQGIVLASLQRTK